LEFQSPDIWEIYRERAGRSGLFCFKAADQGVSAPPENIPKNTVVNIVIRTVFFRIFAVSFWESEIHALKEPGKHACHKDRRSE